MTLNTMRHNGIYNKNNDNNTYYIIGAGSLGSVITLTLAKMGIQRIHVYDNDTLEEHNIPNQYYRVKDIGRPKVEALREIVMDYTGTKIFIHNEFVTTNTPLSLEGQPVLIPAVDNLKERRIIYNNIKDYSVLLLDPRMGGEGFSIYTYNTENQHNKEAYEKSLTETDARLPCGQQNIIYTTLGCTAVLTSYITRLQHNEPIPFKYIYTYKNNNRIITHTE